MYRLITHALINICNIYDYFYLLNENTTFKFRVLHQTNKVNKYSNVSSIKIMVTTCLKVGISKKNF